VGGVKYKRLVGIASVLQAGYNVGLMYEF